MADEVMRVEIGIECEMINAGGYNANLSFWFVSFQKLVKLSSESLSIFECFIVKIKNSVLKETALTATEVKMGDGSNIGWRKYYAVAQVTFSGSSDIQWLR